ncbi:unnamed protein product [Owenia fusiformis]|uniref:Uncharacterized protein n=1 Tax=Owenia fusiformis TaxID=6347 RepID=A0A8J1XIQ6_OWEFU|nr:unnamed protein product [Owenia fusiformis]
MTNEYNWIDCSSHNQENNHIAFAGDTFDLTFKLPYTDFMPPTVPLKFFIRGECVECRLFLPETNSTRQVILALADNIKIMDRDGCVLNEMNEPFGKGSDRKWRRFTERSRGWVDCWATPIVAISIGYTYHPTPHLGDYQSTPPINEDVTTPEKEDQLLIPLRPMTSTSEMTPMAPENFDPTYMDGDKITVELEVGPSVLCVYGALLRQFLHVKENYFGEDQSYSDFDDVTTKLDKHSTFTHTSSSTNKSTKPFDPRNYRPLEVTVQLTIHDIQAHLIKHCTAEDPPCPSIFLERVGFELDKRYLETKLQVLISPAIIIAKDLVQRPDDHQHLKDGHLALSGLQVRGHAMFSHENLPLDSECLEYGWLIEGTIGDLSGRLTAPQLQQIVDFAQTFIFQVEDDENGLQRAVPFNVCTHGVYQWECVHKEEWPFQCPTEHDIKYKMTRLTVDSIDFYAVESGTALNVQVFPIRLSTCNLHGRNNKAGITALIQHVTLRQFIMAPCVNNPNNSLSDLWLEAGGVAIGPITVDAAMALTHPDYRTAQDEFLKIHDKKTHRLWFLWAPDYSVMTPSTTGKCGCLGGCKFFGNNRTGQNFFSRSKLDKSGCLNSATFQLLLDGPDLGYGQSILHKGKLIFDINSSSFPGTPIKYAYVTSPTSPTTPMTNITLMDVTPQSDTIDDVTLTRDQDPLQIDTMRLSESTLQGSTTLHTPRSVDSSVDYTIPVDSESETDTGTATPTRDDISNSESIPSNFFPMDAIPDAYDTDRYASSQSDSTSWGPGLPGSVTSLPEVSKAFKPSHERQRSCDVPGNIQSLISESRSYHGTPPPIPRRLSKTSNPSSGSGGLYQGSTAVSPTLKRLASKGSIHRTISTVSSGSEFFSAAEDSLSEVGSPQPVDYDFPDSFPVNYPRVLHVLKERESSSERNTPERGTGNVKDPETVIFNRQLSRRDRRASDSASTESFVSAQSSSQLSGDSNLTEVQLTEHEMNMLDLHGQINKPITKSPLLMACYNNHVTQMKCAHWSTQSPLPQYIYQPMTPGDDVDNDSSMPAEFSVQSPTTSKAQTHNWVPKFMPVRNGFSAGFMVEKKRFLDPPSPSRVLHSPVSDTDPWENPRAKGLFEGEDQMEVGPAMSYEDQTSKTTAIVKLAGSVDILVSPLLLESLQRYIEAVTPTITKLHPSSIVDKLHFRSSSAVKAQNKLKEQGVGGSTDENDGEKKDEKKLAEETKASQFQLMVTMSKINLCVLQASMVEEVIALSALEHVKDLTCVSLLAVCLDNISCQFLTNHQSERAIEMRQETSPDETYKKFGKLPMGHKRKMAEKAATAELRETVVEKHKEDLVGNLNISKIHFQLRRLTKDCNFTQDVVLTSIPEYRSKVLFTFDKDKISNIAPVTKQNLTGQASPTLKTGTRVELTPEEQILGVIMCEWGLEDISLRAAKRSGYASKPSENTPGMSLTEAKINELQERIREESSGSKSYSNASTAGSKTVPQDQTSVRLEDMNLLENESWASRESIPSSASTMSEEVLPSKLEGDASNCSLEIRGVWFNFAAPPPSPSSRKLEYTRLDWNLLSTATPAINAWMNPSDRLIVATKVMLSSLSIRTSAVMACIMTEGLDVQGIHMPFKSKYNKMSGLSKALQEDPSCQLLTVLRRYITLTPIENIEEMVAMETMPQLLTIQKGLLALTRQWKNIIYLPGLADPNFQHSKRARPLTVSFALPPGESIENLDDEDDLSDVDAENESLLNAGSLKGSVDNLRSRSPERLRHESGDSQDADKVLKSGGRPRNGRESSQIQDSPLPTSFNPRNLYNSLAQQASNIFRRNESKLSLSQRSASCPSLGGEFQLPGGTPVGGTPVKGSALPFGQTGRLENEDLYQWMARQQDMSGEYYFTTRQDSVMNTVASEYSQDETQDVNFQRYAVATTLQLADAQVLFKPLLQSLGLQIEGIRTSPLMKKFGGNISLTGFLISLKIDIIDSEAGSKKTKGKGKGNSKKYPRINMDTGSELPAFQCNLFSAMVQLKDVVDFEKDFNNIDNSARRKSIRTLQWAMDSLEGKPTTTKANLNVNCQSVNQHVNISLVRLVHQVVTMIDNIAITKKELKRNRKNNEAYKTHRKQDSKGSSGTDSQSIHSDSSRTPGVSPLVDQEINEGENLGESFSFTRTSSPGDEQTSTVDGKRSKRPERLVLSGSKKSPKKFTFSKRTRLSELLTPTKSYSQPFSDDHPDSSSPILAEKTIVDEIKENTPKCWRTLYHLLDLYSTMPETKTVGARFIQARLPAISEEPERETPPSGKGDTPKAKREEEDVEQGLRGRSNSLGRRRTYTVGTSFKQSIFIGEHIPLVVFGMAKIRHINITAYLSGLKLESNVDHVHASITHREKIKGVKKKRSSESSATAYIGHSMIALLEGVPPQLQMVVCVNISKSQGLYSTKVKRHKETNSALGTLGNVDIDIPQHPVALHGMVARSSKRISSTLMEFIPKKGPSKTRSADSIDGIPRDQPSKHSDINEDEVAPAEEKELPPSAPLMVVNFKLALQGMTIGASLLPSLKAQYKIGKVSSRGVTGKEARFTVEYPEHSLSFNSQMTTSETNLPTSANIDLPPMHLHAEYRQHTGEKVKSKGLTEGLVFREGNYFNAVAEVGSFEHSLTTDLLNHLVFVQKVFMKEVNEVMQKISGGDKPVPLWSTEGHKIQQHAPNPLLYSLQFKLKGIQITANTPTSSAVRFETGAIELELSNRVLNTQTQLAPQNKYLKVFIKAKVDLNLALGELNKNPMFEEAEPEFQTLAFFKTRIEIRNALQDEMIPGQSDDQEALLISLCRPIIFFEPIAADKAVLVWLNYRNAYEYWNEQRLGLNKEVQQATRQVFDRIPVTNIQPDISTLGTLFLQLTVDDMGICVPLKTSKDVIGVPQLSRMMDNEPGSALVLTIESTLISACSRGSLVSKGDFKGFCLRFTEEFEMSWDDWKPSSNISPVMNACVVPQGTYEVCSRTVNKPDLNSQNAKWILNVLWEMKGIDIHMNTLMGQLLSGLGQTLTGLAGDHSSDLDVVDSGLQNIPSIKVDPVLRKQSTLTEVLPEFVYDTSIEPKQRARLIEREMNEQAKVVQDLKQLGASQQTVESEEQKLHELEQVLSNDFRRDVIQKLKRQSVKATALKDKLGLGYKPAHYRSKSTSAGMHAWKKKDSITDKEKLFRTKKSVHPSLSHNRTQSFDYTKIEIPTVTFNKSTDHSDSDLDLDDIDLLSKTLDDPFDSKIRKSPNIPPRRPLERKPAIIAEKSDGSSSSEEANLEDVYLKHASERTHGPPPPVVTRKSKSSTSKESTASMGSGGSGKSGSTTEIGIDFEFDLKVEIESGQCVLHPKHTEDAEENVKKGVKKTMSGLSSDSSPILGRKKTGKKDSTAKLKQQQSQQSLENTTFFLPGLDVKVHYESKANSNSTESPSGSLKPDISAEILENTSNTSQASATKRPGNKKANLYAWVSLQKLPEEMLISPTLLDYLEQTLEPIHMEAWYLSKAHAKESEEQLENGGLDESMTSLTPVSYAYTFPVNVMVCIRVNPSIIRFTCLPVSRVECILRLPSLDMVFSTKRIETENPLVTSKDGGTPPMKSKLNRERSASGNQGQGRNLNSGSVENLLPGGGLQVTACLSDFSLFIFHPYGGQNKKSGESLLGGPVMTPPSLGSMTDGAASPLSAATGRKDSLSLNVEFVKVNISRSRKGIIQASDTHISPNQLKAGGKKPSGGASNIIRFSTICDIGSASFKYNMRRLSEILALPKAWYRKGLARRLFLGDESAHNIEESDEEDEDTKSSATPPTPETPLPYNFPREDTSPSRSESPEDGSTNQNIAGPEERRSKDLWSKELPNKPEKLLIGGTPLSPTSSNKAKLLPPLLKSPVHHAPLIPQSYDTVDHFRKLPILASVSSNDSTSSQSKSLNSWETLVMFALNLSQLDVHVNMGNVMGLTTWFTKDLKSQGRFAIDSNCRKNLTVTTCLGGSTLDAKGGIVGGAIEIQDITTTIKVKEDPGLDPDHKCGIVLSAIEARLDYMGSSVLMGRTSQLEVSLADEWRVGDMGSDDELLATKRPALIFVHGELQWDKFHLMISKSTTPDLIKMVSKVEEFFIQQLHSSKRVFSNFGTLAAISKPKKRIISLDEEKISEAKHHRHWQKVLEHIAGCTFKMLKLQLPNKGTIVGGTMYLQGDNLSLACFHGINFRSKSWALFTMNEPNISFATESQQITTEDSADTHIVQNLSFQLGHNITELSNKKQEMAVICKLSRGHYMPPPFTSVQEWFHYAFASTNFKNLDSFPTMKRQPCDSPSPTERRSSSRKSQDYSHDTEVIFSLPALQLHLKTEHLQASIEPLCTEPRPIVECSFVTEFEDHIFVAMDAEAVLFLHDLVNSYIKEKDKALMGRPGSYSAYRDRDKEADKKSETDTSLYEDFREYQCKTWHLEPTVRLLYWAGKKIDPVGVDYVLQKLGFQHARLTIPKWMQRGFMDPLDKILAVLVDRLVLVLRKTPKTQEEQNK